MSISANATHPIQLPPVWQLIPPDLPTACLVHLYDSQAPPIYRYIYQRVGNREDAEDLTTQVFIKALQYLDPNQREPQQIAWLYQVARTVVADHWRGFYKEGATRPLDTLRLAQEPLIPDPGPVAADASDRTAQQVAAILDQLLDNYRQVLILRFLEGCSLKATAAAMGTTEGNVKVLQYRALQKARTLGG